MDEQKQQQKTSRQNQIYYNFKIHIKRPYHAALKQLCKETGLSPKELFWRAVEHQYCIELRDASDEYE